MSCHCATEKRLTLDNQAKAILVQGTLGNGFRCRDPGISPSLIDDCCECRRNLGNRSWGCGYTWSVITLTRDLGSCIATSKTVVVCIELITESLSSIIVVANKSQWCVESFSESRRDPQCHSPRLHKLRVLQPAYPVFYTPPSTPLTPRSLGSLASPSLTAPRHKTCLAPQDS